MRFEAYCNRCKKKNNILNPEIKEVISKTRGLTRFCVGNCENCGNKISVILPKEIKSIEQEKKQELPLTPLIQKEQDKSKIETFIKQAEENPIIKRNSEIIEVVDKTEKKVISKSYYNLAIVGLIILICIVGIFVYRTIYPQYFLPNNNSSFFCNASLVCGDNVCSAPATTCNCPSCNCPSYANDCGDVKLYCNGTG